MRPLDLRQASRNCLPFKNGNQTASGPPAAANRSFVRFSSPTVFVACLASSWK